MTDRSLSARVRGGREGNSVCRAAARQSGAPKDVARSGRAEAQEKFTPPALNPTGRDGTGVLGESRSQLSAYRSPGPRQGSNKSDHPVTLSAIVAQMGHLPETEPPGGQTGISDGVGRECVVCSVFPVILAPTPVAVRALRREPSTICLTCRRGFAGSLRRASVDLETEGA